MRKGNSSRGLIVCVLGLALLGGGALVYKNWLNSAKDNNGDADKGHTPGEGYDPKEKFEAKEVVEVPFIFWGGDVATFHANGGLDTKPGSIFAKQGLKVKLTPGDDFPKQVENYLS